jgi:hypothetical protein
VRAGEVLVSTAGDHSPIRAPKGLIHDWIGATLIPNAEPEDIFAVVHDYNRYREFYKPLVIDSKSLGGDGTDYRFSLLMLNKPGYSRGSSLVDRSDCKRGVPRLTTYFPYRNSSGCEVRSRWIQYVRPFRGTG